MSSKTTRLFLSLEGIDFTWKTPFSDWLKRDLAAQGKRVLITRDPPYFLSPWDKFQEFFERGEKMARLSEAYLLLTARLDNYERVIKPCLDQNKIVIADRYTDSWLAYQSVRLAKYFGGENKAFKYLIATQDRLVSDGFLELPNLTIWISQDPKAAMIHASKEKKVSKYEKLQLQVEVDKQYQALYQRYPERIKKVDVRGLDIQGAYIRVTEAIRKNNFL